MKATLLALLASVSLSACIAQNIVGANKRKDFAEINLKREQSGLSPLTWQQYNSPGQR